jgi:hypothetical protein
MVTEAGRYGHGSWTGWSRKPDGMVTVSGQKRKIYCNTYTKEKENDEEVIFGFYELKNFLFKNYYIETRNKL